MVMIIIPIKSTVPHVLYSLLQYVIPMVSIDDSYFSVDSKKVVSPFDKFKQMDSQTPRTPK